MKLFTALALSLLLTTSARAWNDTGHEVVADIVYSELTPAARTAVAELLKQHPRYQKDLLAGLPERFDADRYSFMMAAYWPDMVRAVNHPMHFVANHPEWHFINIDFAPSGPGVTAPTTSAAPSSAPAGPQNVVEALNKAVADLKSDATAPADKAIALCWILHLGGDIHQPLHAVNFISPDFPEGDHGGNGLIVLRQPGQIHSQITLHWLWDTLLGTQHSPVLIDYLAQGIRQDPQWSRRELASELRVTDVGAWANESHEIAIRYAYLNGTIAGANAMKLAADPSLAIPAVPPGYLDTGEKVAMRRVATASYRIADLLNGIFH